VGRLAGRPITVLGAETAAEWPHVFRGVGFVTGIESVLGAPSLEASDHATFIDKGIPAVQLFSGPHLDYHRPGDTADKVEGGSLVDVATFAKEAIAYLAERPDPLTVTTGGFGSGAGAAAGPAGNPGDGGRKVSFGSVPEFSFAGPGVKLQGVAPGSPAEAAGLRAGDVLTHLDGEAIADLRAFSGRLKALEAGQVVRARYVRDGEVAEVDVRLAAR
jgi:membrane-associated protease RseP (regulator of RpoE activity)